MAVIGESDEEKAKKREDRQYRRRLHTDNLQQTTQPDQGSDTAEILRLLSDIDDLPVDPTEDPVMGQLVSKLTSTSNLSTEQVESNEWVREYILLLYLCKRPRPDGLHGSWRGWAHGDQDEDVGPLGPSERMQTETFVSMTKLGLTRSEDFKAVEESTRTINESVVHDDSKQNSGGLMGRFRS